jgi:hypothetical protein
MHTYKDIHIVHWKIGPNKFKKTEIIQSAFSHHSERKLEINNGNMEAK